MCRVGHRSLSMIEIRALGSDDQCSTACVYVER